jgi:hypothetical protein
MSMMWPTTDQLDGRASFDGPTHEDPARAHGSMGQPDRGPWRRHWRAVLVVLFTVAMAAAAIIAVFAASAGASAAGGCGGA